MHVAEIHCDLGDKVHLADDLCRVVAVIALKSKRQGLVVCDDMKVPALQKVAKMLYCEVHSKEFLTEGAVFFFRWFPGF